MIDHKDYERKYSEQYSEDDFELVLVAARRKKVLESMARFPHTKILEVGCGLEPVFQACDSFESYTVVEPVEVFIQAAQALAPSNKKLKFVCARLEDIASRLAEESRFDFIIVSSLLHEVPEPLELLRSVHSLCGEETVAHFNVPNVYSFHRLLAREMGLVESIHEKSETEIKFQRHTRFDKESLQRLLNENGFTILNFGTYFIKPLSNAQMHEILKNGIAGAELVRGLEGMIKYLPEMGVEMFAEVKKRG